jgi:hypothetical protein
MRGQIREIEDVLNKRKAQLAEAMAHLDALLAKPATPEPRLEPKTDPKRGPGESPLVASGVMTLLKNLAKASEPKAAPVEPRAAVELERASVRRVRPMQVNFKGISDENPIKENIRLLFENNPDMSFTTSDIIDLLHLSRSSADAVRQNLKRLFDDTTLMRERDGVYHWNPVPKIGAG